MKTFKINNIDVTNDVLVNTFNYMKRIDDVFGTGSFNFESKDIDYNIPPYSVLTIDNDYFLCNSEATYHFGKQSWFHNVSIIEATSVLSRFLVGSKTFSITGTNTFDYQKIDILLTLINSKYDVNITFPNLVLHYIFRSKIEYVFSAGTTLYDALNEIAKNYNYRIYVKKIEGNNIEIDYVNLTNLQVEEINDNNILSKTKLQNAETYCKYLESEATNVIDVTNTSIVDNLYPTATDIKLSEDTFVLKAPTSIYNVKNFWANIFILLDTFLTFPNSISNTVEYKTYEEWSQEYPVLLEIYENYYKKYIPNWDEFKVKRWKTSFSQLAPETAYSTSEPSFKVDVSSRLLSREQYDLIEDQNKPDYVYYSMGSNIIDGFNIFYKNDLWNTIIGESKQPYFLGSIYEDREYEGTIYKNITISRFRVTDLSSYKRRTYGLEYNPIVNPFLLNTKKDIPDNEIAYKKYALSYGKSSNFVDFDKIYNSMNIENQSIGKTEMIVEYDVTAKDFLYPYRKVNVEGKEWYVSNIQYRITPTQSIGTLNLVQNYNKIADVISLNSQYNTTKNPLQNIVERPIFYETNLIFTFKQGATYVLTEFIYKDGSVKNFVFAPVILTNGDDTYLYFEMQDQYSAGTKPVVVQNDSSVLKIEDVPYVDENNEIEMYSLKIINLESVDFESIKNFPEAPFDWDNYKYDIISSSMYLFKDAREKLTFTIKANNCIIK